MNMKQEPSPYLYDSNDDFHYTKNVPDDCYLNSNSNVSHLFFSLVNQKLSREWNTETGILILTHSRNIDFTVLKISHMIASISTQTQ